MKTIRYTKMDSDKIIELLNRGGLLAMPTDTVFGLACMMDEQAIARVYEAKGRSFDKPLPMMCSSKKMISEVAKISEEAENGSDITFKVNLKQYREYGTQNIILEQNKDGTVTKTKETARETTKQPAKTYTVQKGDTLWNIAKKQLGYGSKYKDLAKINNIANPNLLSVGMVLKLS